MFDSAYGDEPSGSSDLTLTHITGSSPIVDIIASIRSS